MNCQCTVSTNTGCLHPTLWRGFYTQLGDVFHNGAVDSWLRLNLGGDLILDSFVEVKKLTEGALLWPLVGVTQLRATNFIGIGATSMAPSFGGPVKGSLTEGVEATGVAPVILGEEVG